jgi:hypothetical protein
MIPTLIDVCKTKKACVLLDSCYAAVRVPERENAYS